MNIQTIVTVVAALAAGVLGAVVVHPGDAPPPVSEGRELIELRDEVRELARTNRLLLDRVEMLETRPAVAQVPAASPLETAASAPAVRELEREPVAAASGPIADPAVFQEQVTEALQAIRAQEEKEREEEREQRRKERMEEQLARLAQEIGLTPYQTNQLRDVLAKQQQAMEAARDSLRDNRDWEGMRGAMEKLRDETNATLAGFMTQEQIAKFNESSRGFRGFGGRGPRGERGGPGGS